MKRVVLFIFLIVMIQSGCSNHSNPLEIGEASPPFTIMKSGSDGRDVPYGLRGVEGKLAIVDAPVREGADNKQLLHLWGDSAEKTEQLFDRPVTVVGTSQEGKTITAFEGVVGFPNEDIIKPPHFYAESVGYLTLPSTGTWKLDAYIDEVWFGSIVVEVQPGE
ncbi:hypothetical protein [Ammoniphilus sp. YIM 78166]|uniref:hypothetical protein n=1 Tax=Ammoniphilus sp. YIM 78166 TaxID=1644106 RepID=UPI00106F57FC|nr:hypothetical protein [Ammoniphilus sp. YIM 78166]